MDRPFILLGCAGHAKERPTNIIRLADYRDVSAPPAPAPWHGRTVKVKATGQRFRVTGFESPYLSGFLLSANQPRFARFKAEELEW